MIRPVKQQLVILGNGMAGARVAEEILKRDAEAFDITIIGGEPHGNYNRILLSNVLNGTQDAADITLNTLEWYQENGIKLLAGVGPFLQAAQAQAAAGGGQRGRGGLSLDIPGLDGFGGP